MSDRKKNPATWESIVLSKVAYKRSWREKAAAKTLDLKETTKKRGEAFAAEDVNDLRPLRGALSRVIDIFLASAQSQLWGAGAPLFLKKGGLQG